MTTAHRLCAQLRPAIFEQMAETSLDLLVIGGGITGAGIAWDAVLRGLKVGLVDQSDFASGTSSRSTKLIHGGLRYLKQGEIGLVKEVGRERTILHRRAPHVVRPLSMLLPLYKQGTYGPIATSIGLWLYDRLAGVRKAERRTMLSKSATLAAEPLLAPDNLIGGGLYVEYITDDARLTIDVLKTAVAYGALAVNYARAASFLYENGKIAGAHIVDETNGREYDVRARCIVNAAGPWVDAVRSVEEPVHGKRLHLTKGVHIVVRRERLPVRQPIYFDTPDGRMVFAIPRGDVTYIGTTDTNYGRPPGEPNAEPADRDYLLQAANAMFPKALLASSDVISSWAGLRPLIHQEGRNPSELSRRDEIFLSTAGLVTIAGGKLTGFRKMAERVVNLVCERIAPSSGSAWGSCRTDETFIVGSGDREPDAFAQEQEKWLEVGLRSGLPRERVEEWILRYGAQWLKVLDYTDALTAQTSGPSSPFAIDLVAELTFALNNEMALFPEDFLVRRSGLLYFAPDRYEAILDDTVRWYADVHQWDVSRIAEQQARLRLLLQHAKVDIS